MTGAQTRVRKSMEWIVNVGLVNDKPNWPVTPLWGRQRSVPPALPLDDDVVFITIFMTLIIAIITLSLELGCAPVSGCD